MRHDRDTAGAAIVGVSLKFYERSLFLYPEDLRREFGSEMIEVFDDQVSEAYSRSGFIGLLRVWSGATREFVTVALPGRLSGRCFRWPP